MDATKSGASLALEKGALALDKNHPERRWSSHCMLFSILELGHQGSSSCRNVFVHALCRGVRHGSCYGEVA
jgi:hypothetical protein